MSFKTLPTELRLHIYQHIAELQPGRHDTVGPRIPLTPAICRASSWLRSDTLPLYAANTHFAIQIDEDSCPELEATTRNKVSVWLDALGPHVKHLQSFQFSTHWKITQPTRWQGHVGFYVRLQRNPNNEWESRTGTYPVARDKRGMRVESMQLLQSVLRDNVIKPAMARETQQLWRRDVEFVTAAMRIVASHTIALFDSEQVGSSQAWRRNVWDGMEHGLLELSIVCRQKYPV